MPIKFGTDGWRDIIAQDFTFDNVRRVAQAHATYLVRGGGRSVVVGFDTRFSSDRFAQVAAEVMAEAGLHVYLADEFLPTPALSFAVRHLNAAGGVMITASHNPPQYSGYKIKGPYGGSATPSIAHDIEALLFEPFEPASTPGRVERLDVRQAYYAALDARLDLDVLRRHHGVLYHDAMGGAGAGWVEGYARHANLNVEVRGVHDVPHPLFHGLHPEPIAPNLGELSRLLRNEQDPTFAMATDGDADRVGVVTAGGRYFNSHQVFAVLVRHLFERGQRGRVVKTVSGSSLIDRLCAHLGLEVVETPIGFKYITDAFLEGLRDPSARVLMGGEESGGMAVQGHVPERDGILSGLLLLEAVVRSGKSLGEQFAELEALTGWQHHYDRVDLHLDPHVDKAAWLADARRWRSVAGRSVREVVSKDGVKLVLHDGAWAMLRASGTEPLLRVYVEAQSPQAVRELLDYAVRPPVDAREVRSG